MKSLTLALIFASATHLAVPSSYADDAATSDDERENDPVEFIGYGASLTTTRNFPLKANSTKTFIQGKLVTATDVDLGPDPFCHLNFTAGISHRVYPADGQIKMKYSRAVEATYEVPRDHQLGQDRFRPRRCMSMDLEHTTFNQLVCCLGVDADEYAKLRVHDLRTILQERFTLKLGNIDTLK
ncbi:MAG: hypothetical protein AB7F66_03940 [Bacteriovoracia bacterium]